MKVTLNWLREFVPVELPPDRLAERLTMAGLEVEEIRAQGTEPVQVAQITRIAPHPQAEHLVVCYVTTGGETAPVVCGATNMRVGDKVAFAPAGTLLPAGQRVERVEIRGQLSCGMLCSEAELGLSHDHSGVLILPTEAPLGSLKARTRHVPVGTAEFSAIDMLRPPAPWSGSTARRYSTPSGRSKRSSNKRRENYSNRNNFRRARCLSLGRRSGASIN